MMQMLIFPYFYLGSTKVYYSFQTFIIIEDYFGTEIKLSTIGLLGY